MLFQFNQSLHNIKYYIIIIVNIISTYMSNYTTSLQDFNKYNIIVIILLK